MKNIAIVGAGITGVTTAYALTQHGYQITVLDRQRYPAMETSFANGGQLSASNAEVWNRWKNVMHGLVTMHRKNAPLLINLAPSWHKYSWFAEFIANIPHYRANTIATARLAIRARQILFDLAARENIEFDLERRGILHVYNDRSAFEHAQHVSQLLAAAGLKRQTLSSGEIQEIEPALRRAYFGGFFTPDDATGDIHKFTRGLAETCIHKGAQFLQDANVEHIRHCGAKLEILWSSGLEDGARREPIFVDGVIICAGVGSRRLGAMLGDRVNIYPVKGYSITVALRDQTSRHAAPQVSLLDDEAKIVTSRLGDRFRVAGTAEFNGYDYDIRAARIEPLVAWVRKEFPQLDTSLVAPWCGLRPMLPNMMPRIGAGKRPGVFYNTGHGHLGWTLAAATAEMIAGNVVTQLPP